MGGQKWLVPKASHWLSWWLLTQGWHDCAACDLNDNAQTPLNRFTVYMLYSHLCYKYSENRTDGAYALVYHTYSVDRRRWNKQRRQSYLYQLAACGGEIFSKSTVVQTKISHVSKTTPLLGVICHPLARLDIVSLCTKCESSSFSHSWDMDGAPKI